MKDVPFRFHHGLSLVWPRPQILYAPVCPRAGGPPGNIQTFAEDTVISAFRTKIEAALFLAAASCLSPVAAASPVEYPVTIRAQAPNFPEKVSIRRLPDDADRKQLIDTHRMFRPEHRQIFLTLRTPSWWLITPRAQRTGGYRLRVRLDAETASACLDPPRGLVTLAFATPSYFVALPRQVKRIDWQDICAPWSAPSGEGSGCESSAGSGAPRR